MQFRVLHISNNLDEYPHCAKDSGEYPDLVDFLDDEYEMWILDVSTGAVYPACEFFFMADNLHGFSSSQRVQRLEDELTIAVEYIKTMKKIVGEAKTSKDEHLACWSAVNYAPVIVDDRVEISNSQHTWLRLKKES